MAKIALYGMRFNAFHGYYPEENVLGQEYLVDVTLSTPTNPGGLSDELEHTINYETVYRIVKAQMKQPSKLLEHVVERIIKALKHQFDNIGGIEVSLKKLNPPLGGQVAYALVSVEHHFEKTCGRCGGKMVCYSNESCWCTNAGKIPPKTLEAIKRQFGNKCLCSKCLVDYTG